MLIAHGLTRLYLTQFHALPTVRSRSALAVATTTKTAALYVTMDNLIRCSERSPSVRALSKRWTTMPPGELVENALIIGRSLVGNFSHGFALLDQAEDAVGLGLSQRAYAALMLLGQAEQEHIQVLGLLGRLRGHDIDPSPSMLRTAMSAAAELEDWGAVSRLFSELAGSDSPVEALELIGPPDVIDELRTAAVCETDDAGRLTAADADALRLALRAHCARGDSALVVSTLRRMRKLECALTTANYAGLIRLASIGNMSPIRALRTLDLWRSLSSAFEPQLFTILNMVTRLTRSDRELILLAVFATLGSTMLSVMLTAAEGAPRDPFV